MYKRKPNLKNMSRKEKEELLMLLEEKERRLKYSRWKVYYPETGRLSRHGYVKHMKFFAAGAKHRQRLMLAANRVGKTEGVGAYETMLHLTGMYPEWWTGRRFDHPIDCWAAGDTNETVRDIIQYKLLGDFFDMGSGMIPKEVITGFTRRQGVPEAVESVSIKHVSGGISTLKLKSYVQGRKSFQGTEKHLIWLDEEPPLDIYTECLTRTMTTGGMAMLTFTPLSGMSDVVMSFLEDGKVPEENVQLEEGEKYVIMATWDDAPHLTKEQKEELWSAFPPHEREARAKGVPQLGSGAIYRTPEDDVVVDDFPIPSYWPRGYGMDVGWQATAVVWYAYDPDADILYQTGEYKRGHAEPETHVKAIKARGDWMIGAIDPAANGRNQKDGTKLIEEYSDAGLNVINADNAVSAGIYYVNERESTGRLKIFKSCRETLSERRLYRRDEDGRIVKTNDHLQDARRYGAFTKGILTEPPMDKAFPDHIQNENYNPLPDY